MGQMIQDRANHYVTPTPTAGEENKEGKPIEEKKETPGKDVRKHVLSP